MIRTSFYGVGRNLAERAAGCSLETEASANLALALLSKAFYVAFDEQLGDSPAMHADLDAVVKLHQENVRQIEMLWPRAHGLRLYRSPFREGRRCYGFGLPKPAAHYAAKHQYKRMTRRERRALAVRADLRAEAKFERDRINRRFGLGEYFDDRRRHEVGRDW